MKRIPLILGAVAERRSLAMLMPPEGIANHQGFSAMQGLRWR